VVVRSTQRLSLTSFMFPDEALATRDVKDAVKR
jgi:hypothetical protein